jgi:hypothetical protein
MSMLNDRDRHLLNDLERQLEHEDPAGVRQFKDPQPPPDRPLPLLDIPVAAVIFGSTVIVLAYVHYRRQRLRGPTVELAVFGHSGVDPHRQQLPNQSRQHDRHDGTPGNPRTIINSNSLERKR